MSLYLYFLFFFLGIDNCFLFNSSIKNNSIMFFDKKALKFRSTQHSSAEVWKHISIGDSIKYQIVLSFFFRSVIPHIFLCHVCNHAVAQLSLHCVWQQDCFYSQRRYRNDTELRPAACSPSFPAENSPAINTAKYEETKGSRGEVSTSLMHYWTFFFFLLPHRCQTRQVCLSFCLVLYTRRKL